jgi:hypothetical protein
MVLESSAVRVNIIEEENPEQPQVGGLFPI